MYREWRPATPRYATRAAAATLPSACSTELRDRCAPPAESDTAARDCCDSRRLMLWELRLD